jgi:hypothetical protein
MAKAFSLISHFSVVTPSHAWCGIRTRIRSILPPQNRFNKLKTIHRLWLSVCIAVIVMLFDWLFREEIVGKFAALKNIILCILLF